ncbi:MAG TPA: aminoacyl-tRNA hydrolase, partial [Pseudomonadales bacterium]|nr:aminoacyl-tRNA hydrolase [Pseudomonadales bacterium]
MSHPLRLIVGLGNPGDQYRETRHNAGAWFVGRYAESLGAAFKDEKKFFGRMATATIEGREVRFLLPSTYMNESGKSVGAVANFFKMAPEEILIAHDELDLAIGIVRFKPGGGLAGHNGLRDISASLGGSQAFNRLRIGVGHPGDKSAVIGHVLSKASREDKTIIDACIDEAMRYMPIAV